MDGNVLTVERLIPAPAEKIFDLVADPTRHPDIDGSGTVRQAHDEVPRRVGLGDVFGMSMKLGVNYSMANTVVEYEDDKRIAWQAAPRNFLSKILAGRIWRYELEAKDGGTLVRESWDLSKDKQRFLLRHGPLPKQTKANMERTLERIEKIVTSSD